MRKKKIGFDIDEDQMLADLAKVTKAVRTLQKQAVETGEHINLHAVAGELSVLEAQVRQAGGRAGGAFADNFNKRVTAGLKAIPVYKIDADTTPAQYEIIRLRGSWRR